MTSIQWTDATWNPVRGCSRVSRGCDNCYAMRQAHRFNTPSPKSPYHGLTTIRRGKVDWFGTARLVPEQLEQPFHWRKPRRVFVNSMSDLFHESLSNENIAAVFGVMAAALQHTFQVLTKRPKRARDWFEWLKESGEDPCEVICCQAARVLYPGDENTLAHSSFEYHSVAEDWPLPNVWLGVSAENQATADERIPLLLETPAAVRFVSAEPLLERVDIAQWLRGTTRVHCCMDVRGALRSCAFDLQDASGRALTRAEAKAYFESQIAAGVKVVPLSKCDTFDDQTGCRGHRMPGIDWIIVGGESGHGARACDLRWVESIVAQCGDAGVACFVKQLGSKPIGEWPGDNPPRVHLTDITVSPPRHSVELHRYKNGAWRLVDRKGGSMDEWPAALRVREFPKVRHA